METDKNPEKEAVAPANKKYHKSIKKEHKTLLPSEFPDTAKPVDTTQVWTLYPALAKICGIKTNKDPYLSAKKSVRLWLPVFLSRIENDMNIAEACRACGVARSVVYKLRDEMPEFASAWEAAKQVCIDSLESEMILRGRDGCLKPVVSKGEVVTYVFDKSDKMLEIALKAKKPAEYNTTKTELEMSGPGGKPIEVKPVVVLPPLEALPDLPALQKTPQ